MKTIIDKRNQIIIFLIIVGVLLFGIVEGMIIPGINEREQQYIAAQEDPLTHDFERVLRFKNRYMGNASNLSNLFHSLPLSEVGISFRLFPDELTVEVNYGDTVWRVGETKVEKGLIYNATAGFALIDNLEHIAFNFVGASYAVSRKDVQEFHGINISTLAEKKTWENNFQKRLQDNEYVRSYIKAVLKKQTL